MSSFKRDSSDGKPVNKFQSDFKQAVIKYQKQKNYKWDKYKSENLESVIKITNNFISKCLNLYTRIFNRFEKQKLNMSKNDALIDTRNHYRKNNKEIIKRYLGFIREDISAGMGFLLQSNKFPDGDLGEYEIKLQKIEILKKILKMYDDDNSNGGSALPEKHILDILPEAPQTPLIYMPEVPTHEAVLKDSSIKSEKKRVAIEVKRNGGSLKLKKKQKKNKKTLKKRKFK